VEANSFFFRVPRRAGFGPAVSELFYKSTLPLKLTLIVDVPLVLSLLAEDTIVVACRT